jgi:hypothetical protein
MNGELVALESECLVQRPSVRYVNPMTRQVLNSGPERQTRTIVCYDSPVVGGVVVDMEDHSPSARTS